MVCQTNANWRKSRTPRQQIMNELKDYYLQLDDDYAYVEQAHDFVKNRATWKYVPYIWL